MAFLTTISGFLLTPASQAMLTIPIFDFQSNPILFSPSWHFLKVRVQGSCVLCAHGSALFIPNQLLFFSPLFLCQSREMHHKGHGHGFPLVWLNEKVRWGHHEMALRPSHHPHRDQSPYITLKWHSRSPSRAALTGTTRVPWAAVTSSDPPVALVSQRCVEKELSRCGAVIIACCLKWNFWEQCKRFYNCI